MRKVWWVATGVALIAVGVAGGWLLRDSSDSSSPAAVATSTSRGLNDAPRVEERALLTEKQACARAGATIRLYQVGGQLPPGDEPFFERDLAAFVDRVHPGDVRNAIANLIARLKGWAANGFTQGVHAGNVLDAARQLVEICATV